MNSKKWITAAGVFVLGASLAFAAPQMGEGHEGNGEHHHHHGQMLGKRMAEKLKLTDAQKQQVADLQKSFEQNNEAFLKAAHQTRKDFHAAKEANDTAKMAALKPTLESQRAQMKQLRAAQMQKMEALLTTEQKAQLQQLKAEHEQRERSEQK